MSITSPFLPLMLTSPSKTMNQGKFAASGYPDGLSPSSSNPQSNLARRKRHRNHRTRRSPDAPSPQQAMFNSAQDVTIERSMFNTAGHGSVIVNVNPHVISSTRTESENENTHFRHPSDTPMASGPSAPLPKQDVDRLSSFGVISIPKGSDCSSPRIYQEQLLSKKRGTPLWLPGPNRNLPKAYRLRGLCIGDVGTLNDLGGFSFLFNIFEGEYSEINRGKVPKGFKPLAWISELAERTEASEVDGVDVDDVEEHKVYGAGSWLGSETIEAVFDSSATDGLTFQTCASEGAILAMPRGATSQDLNNRQVIEDYMSANLESWYIYANHKRGRQAKNGDVRLVYGCDKVSSWGIATFKRESVSGTIRSSEQKMMQFKPTGSTHSSRSASFSWSYVDGGDGRAGPSDEDLKGLKADLDDNAPHGSDAIENQCVFVRTLNAKLSQGTWKKIMGDETSNSSGDGMHGSQPQDPSSGGTGKASQRGGHSNSTSFDTGPSGGSSSGSSVSNIQYMTMEGQPLPLTHPAEILNDSLLRLHPCAKMAITSDADWLSVLDCLNDKMNTAELLKLGIHSLHFERLMRLSHQVVDTNGVIRIRRPSAPAAALLSDNGHKKSTLRPTFKIYPELYSNDRGLCITTGTKLFRICTQTFPKSLMSLVSGMAVRKTRRGVMVVRMLADDFAALLAEHSGTSALEGKGTNQFASHSTSITYSNHLHVAVDHRWTRPQGLAYTPQPVFNYQQLQGFEGSIVSEGRVHHTQSSGQGHITPAKGDTDHSGAEIEAGLESDSDLNSEDGQVQDKNYSGVTRWTPTAFASASERVRDQRASELASTRLKPPDISVPPPVPPQPSNWSSQARRRLSNNLNPSEFAQYQFEMQQKEYQRQLAIQGQQPAVKQVAQHVAKRVHVQSQEIQGGSSAQALMGASWATPSAGPLSWEQRTSLAAILSSSLAAAAERPMP